jgi:GGDEF domain-containing protein
VEASIDLSWVKSRWKDAAAAPLLVSLCVVAFATIGWLVSSFAPAAAAGLNAFFALVVGGTLVARRRAISDDAEYAESQVSELRRQVDGVRRAAIYDEATGLLNRWFFELRLAEEIARSSRYSLHFALLTIRILPTEPTGNPIEWEMTAARVAHQAARAIRTADIPAAIGDLEYAVCLVHCDRDGAESAAQRLIEELQGYRFEIGVAVFPEDQGQAKELIETARARTRWAVSA